MAQAIITLEEIRKAFPNNKTRQDHQPVGERERVDAQNARVSWMQAHKPASASDWLPYRGH